MYHQVSHSRILYGAVIVFSVLEGSLKKQRLLPYTTLIDWFGTTKVESVYWAVCIEYLYEAETFRH